MRAARIAVVSVVVSVALWSAAAQSQAQAADPLVGTWTLDFGKSKFSPGPGPKGLTLTFSETADGVKTVSDVVLADGQTVHQGDHGKAGRERLPGHRIAHGGRHLDDEKRQRSDAGRQERR